MHPNNIKEGKFDITDYDQLESLSISLDDNGEHEYSRYGIGKDKNGWFIVNIDDTGFRYREKLYVNKSLDLKQILELGVKHKVFAKGGHHGYQFRVDNEAGNWETFISNIV